MPIRKIVARSIGVDVITAEDLADNSITAAEITNGAVTADKLASNSVTTAKITDANVTTAKLATTLTVTHALGSASTPSLTFTGDTNTGIFSPAADTIAFAEGGVESMRIDDSGKVGIGTTTMTNRLNVAGAVQSSSTLVAVEANTVALSQEASYSRLAAFGPNSSTGGTLYLYSISSNGSVQNGMVIDPSGRVTKPSQPYCFVGKSNGNVSAQNTIIFNDITANVGSHYNSSNGRFTAPVTGYYFISLNILGTSSSGVEASIRRNGSVVLNSRDAGGTSNYVSTAASTVISMSANDYLTVYVEGSYGANGDSGSGYTSMTAYLLG